MSCPACGRPLMHGESVCPGCGGRIWPALVTFLDPLLVGRQVHIYDGQITKLTSAVAQIIPDPVQPGVMTIVTQSGSRYTGCIGQAAPVAPLPPPDSPRATQVLPTIPAGYPTPEMPPQVLPETNEPKRKKRKKKEKPAQLPMTLGLVGGGLMFVGVFLPLIQGPLGLSISYVANGSGDGMIVLALALITVVCSMTRKYMPLLLTGIVSAGLLIRVAIMLSEIGRNADNPLASKIASTFNLSVGWGVTMIGAVITVVASVVPRTERKK